MKIKLPTKKSIMARGPKDQIQLYYGPPGTGKTTFVDGLAPRVFFISTDRGTRNYNMLRVECLSWKKVRDTIDALVEEEEPYDMVCIDHVDDFMRMAEKAACKKLGVTELFDAGYGKGWNLYQKLVHEALRDIMSTGAGMVLCCHEADKKIKVDGIERDVIMPDMNKIAWKQIIPVCDIVGRIFLRRIKKGGKRVQARVLVTTPTESMYAKDRTSRRRPAEGEFEELDSKAFLRSFDHGKKQEEQEEPRRGRRAR